MMVATSGALLLSGLAPGLTSLFIASILVGISAATAQIVIPWSSSPALPSDRGRVVGVVMSGLLLGILLARVITGVIAEVGGWRSVHFVGAGLMAVLTVVVYPVVPADRGHLRAATTAAWVATIAGWLLLVSPGTPMVTLLIRLVVFDFGVQASQLSNQSAIYALEPEARSRVTTAYMVAYFTGAVAGSISTDGTDATGSLRPRSVLR